MTSLKFYTLLAVFDLDLLFVAIWLGVLTSILTWVLLIMVATFFGRGMGNERYDHHRFCLCYLAHRCDDWTWHSGGSQRFE
jgi:hypothetical protein